MAGNEKINLKENLGVLFENLEKFLTTKTVIGEQIKVGDTIIIPVISVSFGLGGGGGSESGDSQKGAKGAGEGAGAGAKIAPTAIIVIKDDKVELLAIKRSGSFDKLVEMAPEIISKIRDEMKPEDKKEAE